VVRLAVQSISRNLHRELREPAHDPSRIDSKRRRRVGAPLR
jgi:hypothetical protein